MACLIALQVALMLQCASAAWKHHQPFQAVLGSPVDSARPVGTSHATWAKSFEDGLRQSKVASSKESAHGPGHRWVAKTARAGAVPAEMLNAEHLMAESLADAPEGSVRDNRKLMFATRLYYHAKWLAERQQATAAEERYLRSKDLALELQNEDVAAHSLSRLGYFLTLWGRHEDARRVLNEAVELTGAKPNNVASYLLGTLERRVATSISSFDLHRLLEADRRILASQMLPSTDIEEERLQLIAEIHYWRAAEASPTKCFESENALHIMICGVVHLAKAVHVALS